MNSKIRAKFETKKKQKEFFIQSKKNLGLSVRKLAPILDISTGAMENYISGRTAPPIIVIKKMEELSGIKARYERTNGKVIRQQRKLTPLSQENAKRILKRTFKNKYKNVIRLIKENKTMVEITNIMREKGFRFDNSSISRAIGTYRTNLRINIINELDRNGKIVCKGNVRKVKGSLEVGFSLDGFYNTTFDKIKIGMKITKDFKHIRIFPCSVGKLLHKTLSKRLRFLVPIHIKLPKNVDIVINPKDFNMKYSDCIQDKDAKLLAKEALKRNIPIYPIRSTNINRLGDIILEINNKLTLIEITKAKTKRIASHKIGQCLIQKSMSPNITNNFIICRNNLFNINELKALQSISVKVINTEFKPYWEKNVLKEITKYGR